ncbi:MAG: flavin reductase family protein [Lachnospiraceae bacterium]|nr:flavin reductase family protein [Lachnospiraceae bacterium]
MSKQTWKAGNMVYPLPAVMVTCQSNEENANIITVAWTGTICTNPAMVYISVRPERHSYGIIKESMEFVINLTTNKIVKETDKCGVVSGRDVDKFELTGLTKQKANMVKAPLIEESPVNIECKVEQILELGSHHMFIAKVLCVNVDESYLDETGRLDLHKAGLITYSHGEYYDMGEYLGKFGYSVKKKKKKK